ncbi:hypothetical protein HDU76_009837, partial [Blyttiomyces sp. JEL0837]
PSSAFGGVKASTPCDKDLVVFINDINSCVPNAFTKNGFNPSLKFNLANAKCICNGTILPDLDHVQSSCSSSDAQVASGAKDFQNQVKDYCNTISTVHPSTVTATCQSTLTQFVSSVNTCIPAALSSNGGHLPDSPSQMQVQCLCSTTTVSDNVGKVLSDCVAAPDVISMGNQFQSALTGLCKSSGIAPSSGGISRSNGGVQRKSSVGEYALGVAVLVGVVGFAV